MAEAALLFLMENKFPDSLAAKSGHMTRQWDVSGRGECNYWEGSTKGLFFLFHPENADMVAGAVAAVLAPE